MSHFLFSWWGWPSPLVPQRRPPQRSPLGQVLLLQVQVHRLGLLLLLVGSDPLRALWDPLLGVTRLIQQGLACLVHLEDRLLQQRGAASLGPVNRLPLDLALERLSLPPRALGLQLEALERPNLLPPALVLRLEALARALGLPLVLQAGLEQHLELLIPPQRPLVLKRMQTSVDSDNKHVSKP
jgi:hypothetical protein